MIEAWASFQGFTRKDGGDGTGMVDFKSARRANATDQSTTDPHARLMRKGNGQAAKRS